MTGHPFKVSPKGASLGRRVNGCINDSDHFHFCMPLNETSKAFFFNLEEKVFHICLS